MRKNFFFSLFVVALVSAVVATSLPAVAAGPAVSAVTLSDGKTFPYADVQTAVGAYLGQLESLDKGKGFVEFCIPTHGMTNESKMALWDACSNQARAEYARRSGLLYMPDTNGGVSFYCMYQDGYTVGHDELESFPYFTTIDDAAAYLRNELKNKNTRVELFLDTSSLTFGGVRISSSVCTDPHRLKNALFTAAIACDNGENVYATLGGARTSWYWSIDDYKCHPPVSGYFLGYECHISSEAEDSAFQAFVRAAVETCPVRKGSEHDRAAWAYEYIAGLLSYDFKGLESEGDEVAFRNSAVGAIVAEKDRFVTMCNGYASLYNALAVGLGLESHLILGTAGPNGGGHGWNLVKLGNRYYNLDVTWGDNDTEEADPYWFLRGTSVFDSSHVPDASYFDLGLYVNEASLYDYMPAGTSGGVLTSP